MRVRQSTFTKDCLRSMQYYLEAPAVYHGGSKRAIGTGYHAGLEYLYGHRMEHGHDASVGNEVRWAATEAFHNEVERAGENFNWDKDFPDAESCLTVMDSMLVAYLTGTLEDGSPIRWPLDWKVLGVEMDVSLPFYGEHTKGGSMDLVLEDPNGYIIGVDHKTAGKMWDRYKHTPRKNLQASWYTGALMEMFPDAPGHRFVFDIITYAGKFERRIADATPAHVKAAEDKAIQVVSLYEGMRANGMDLPANPASTLCSARYCDFFGTKENPICPHGAVLDSE